MKFTANHYSLNALHNEMEHQASARHFLTPALNQNASKGHLRFSKLANGLSLHACDHIEQQNGMSSMELTPCLSFNILYQGQVSFCLGSEQYTLRANDEPILFALAVPEQEVFTRFLKQHQQVTKVNVSAPKSWLMQRSPNQSDQHLLQQLFATTAVFQLPLDKRLETLGRNVLTLKHTADLKSSLCAEMLALQLFSECVEAAQLNRRRQLIAAMENSIPLNPFNCPIKQFIDEQYLAHSHLEDIADKLGFSVSTLQRRFKQAHGVSVNSYIRNRRLELAKQQLVFEQLSIGEVAYNAGYNHVSNFNSAFKKRFGLSPAQFLKQHWEQE